MKKHVFLGFLFCISFAFSSLFAQDFSKDYKPLKAKGNIPADFTDSYIKKIRDDKRGGIVSSDRRSDKKLKDEFKTISHYAIDRNLLSGKVLFGDPVTDYINKVADKLLENDPDLRKKLRFYAVKDAEVNAFSTYQGIVFVNLGLLAQVQNEAQLAFVLAHEIAHYTENHVMTSYLRTQRALKSRDFNKLHRSDKVIELSSYSKEYEFEADELALKRMLKTDYGIQYMEGIFDVLMYSYLPYDEVDFTKTFLENENYYFPKEFLLKKTQAIKVSEDYDDSKSSHPNIRRRKELFEKLVEKSREKGANKAYLTSEKEFEIAQWQSRFEMSRIYLANQNYGMAIYNSFLLLQQYPDNAYAQIVLAKAIFGLGCHGILKIDKSVSNQELSKKIEFSNGVFDDYTKLEGSVQGMYYFFYQFNREELIGLGVKQLWEAASKFGDKHGIKDYAEKALHFYVEEYNKPLSSFLTKPRAELLKELETSLEEAKAKESENATKSKIEKIEQKKDAQVTEKLQKESDFNGYVFYSLKDNPAFKSVYLDAYDKKKPKTKQKQERLTLKEKAEKIKEEEREEKRAEKNGESLGIKRVVLLEPYYVYLRNKTMLHTDLDFVPDFSKADVEREKLTNVLASASKATGVNIHLIDPKTFGAKEIEKYNDMAALKVWLSEFSNLDGREFLITETHELNDMMNELRMEHVMLAGVIKGKVATSASWIFVWPRIIVFPPSVQVYSDQAPLNVGFITGSIIDIKNASKVFEQEYEFNLGIDSDILKQYFYHIFNQIGRKPN